MMVKLLFQNEHIDWSKMNTHVELFAGDMSVTRGEWQAAVSKER